jgi:hypothetical protein
MIECAEFYSDYVRSISATLGYPLLVEARVDCPAIHAECWGTLDAAIRGGKELHLFEYKYGHRFVDAFENWQLISYTSGLLETYDAEWDGDVHLHVIQPRCSHPTGNARTWSTTAKEVRRLAEALSAACDYASAPEGEDVACNVGVQCRDCRARQGCVALSEAAYAAMEYSASREVFDLSPRSAAVELLLIEESIEALEYRATGLRAQVEAALRAGERLPNYLMAPSSGREKWLGTDEEVIALGDMMGMDLRKPSVITPAQARKKFKAAIAGIEAQTVRPSSLKLRRADPNQLRRLFTQE